MRFSARKFQHNAQYKSGLNAEDISSMIKIYHMIK
jgi:hypothetical protein